MRYVKALPTYLNVDEIQRLLEGAGNRRDYLIIRMAFAYGLRRRELINLNIEDVDFENDEILVLGKGSKERKVTSLDGGETLALLREFLGEQRSGPVFISLAGPTVGQRISDPITINKVFERAVKNSGLENPGKVRGKQMRYRIHPHTLRHCHAVHSLKQGVNIRYIQQNLGHSELSTTAVYLQLELSDRKKEYNKHSIEINEVQRKDDLPSIASMEENRQLICNKSEVMIKNEVFSGWTLSYSADYP